GTVSLHDAQSGERLQQLQDAKGVSRLTYDRHGKRLAGALDTTLRIWDVATGKPAAPLHGHSKRVTGLAFDAGGHRIAAAAEDGTTKIWDLATGQEVLTLRPFEGARIWDGTPRTPELLLRRQVAQMVNAHFEKALLKADLLEHVRA